MTSHVKVHGIIPRIQYLADGTLTEYEFPFVIFKTSDIDVYFGDSKQDISTYRVSDARRSDGGSVTFNAPPAKGIVITIVRNLSIERTTDFQEGGALRANVLNDELDYQIACQQQIADSLNRSMVLPPYAMDTDVNLTLPTPSAGKAIVWNSAGTNLENSAVEVNALESTLNEYKTVAQNAAITATEKADTASNKADIATTQAQIAIQKANEAISIVDNKANTNMENLTDEGRSKIITYGMPDYNSAITLGTITLPYECPYDGYYIFYVDKSGANKISSIFINEIPVCMTNFSNTYSSDTFFGICSAGDVITAENTLDGKLHRCQYIPYKGGN